MNPTIFNEQSRFIWVVILLTASLLSMMPFFYVTYVPSADLPQHLSQLKLFFSTIADPNHSPYEAQYFGANLLVYWVMMLFWLCCPPVLTGKLTMALMVVLWIVSVFLLARSQNRSPVAAFLVSVAVFNSSFYWGFVNFLIGFPLFILWYVYVVNKEIQQRAVIYFFTTVIVSILLFFAHAFWMVLAIVILGVHDLLKREKLRVMLWHGIALLPVIVIAALWYPRLSAARTTLGFDTLPHWFVMPWERLYPKWIVNAIFGGLQGPSEWLVFFGLTGWILLVIVTNKKSVWEGINKNLFTVSIILFVGIYTLPDKFMNTIFFASRWYPVAMIFFILSLPMPKLPQVVYSGFAGFLVIMFSLTTILAWTRYNDIDQSGLTEALEQIPEHVRVIGLDYIKESQYIEGRPFLQTFAYAQALHGSTLNFSFAEHNSGIVIPKKISPVPQWTPGLEWIAEYVMYEDFQKFDYALINATDEFHKIMISLAPISPVTDEGRWRLYRILEDSRKGFVITF